VYIVFEWEYEQEKKIAWEMFSQAILINSAYSSLRIFCSVSSVADILPTTLIFGLERRAVPELALTKEFITVWINSFLSDLVGLASAIIKGVSPTFTQE
jgi:hypothetical protein